MGSIPGSGRSPGRGGHGNPLQCSCLEDPHGQRCLAGYSAGGPKELDTTERLTHTMVLYLDYGGGYKTLHLDNYPYTSYQCQFSGFDIVWLSTM